MGSIAIEYLLPEQLIYELKLRKAYRENSTKREMTKDLRQVLEAELKNQNPILKLPEDSALDLSLTVAYLESLESVISSPPESVCFPSVEAQLWHLEGRVNRIKAEGGNEEDLSKAKLLLAKIIAKTGVLESTLDIDMSETATGKQKTARIRFNLEEEDHDKSFPSRPGLSSTMRSKVGDPTRHRGKETGKGEGEFPRRSRTTESNTYDVDSELEDSAEEGPGNRNFEQLFKSFATWCQSNPSVLRGQGAEGHTRNCEKTRSRTPIRKWQLRWTGDESKDELTLKQFIRLVEQQARSRGFDADDLFQNALYLLAGKARVYFLNNCDKWQTWRQLKDGLRLKFLSAAPDFTMLDKIIERKQGAQEATLDYIDAMLTYFNGMDSLVHDDLKMHYIIRNMRGEVRAQVKPFRNSFGGVDDMIRHCKSVEEDLDSRRKEKKVDPESRVEELLASDERAERMFESFAVRYFNRREAPDSVQFRGGVESCGGIGEPAGDRQFHGLGTHIRPQAPEFVPMGNGMRGRACWNCGQRGHGFMMCPEPIRDPFCFRCGRKGTVTPRCPNCSVPGPSGFRQREESTKEQ